MIMMMMMIMIMMMMMIMVMMMMAVMMTMIKKPGSLRFSSLQPRCSGRPADIETNP